MLHLGQLSVLQCFGCAEDPFDAAHVYGFSRKIKKTEIGKVVKGHWSSRQRESCLYINSCVGLRRGSRLVLRLSFVLGALCNPDTAG